MNNINELHVSHTALFAILSHHLFYSLFLNQFNLSSVPIYINSTVLYNTCIKQYKEMVFDLKSADDKVLHDFFFGITAIFRLKNKEDHLAFYFEFNR